VPAPPAGVSAPGGGVSAPGGAGITAAMTDLLPDPDDPGAIEPLEERPEVAAAIEDDVTAPGLGVPGPVPDDPDTPRFEPPAVDGDAPA
jgi:hypothetical protein